MRLEFAHVSFAVTCLDACMKTLGIYLKSVHFKNPVVRSSFLFKMVVIFNTASAESKQSQLMLYENGNNFERNEDCATVFLK